MIQITDKTKCCGCSSCANACPRSAINMLPDSEGFIYPIVDKALCINCGICNRVCPIENRPINSSPVRESYVLRAVDKDVLMNSTSGGFITPLAEYVLDHHGVLCAAAYDKDFKIKHIIIDKVAEYYLSNIRGSKYVQSSLGDCYIEIKRYLERKRMVCFVGTTCQVNGLKAFLCKEYEQLITVDLVCHGTPSPKLWDKYLNYQKTKYHSKIQEISFRNKTYGYHSGTMKICFSNGKIYYGSARVDYMLKSFFREIASRPICYQCPFKTLDRCSDFTIYDCWHASELIAGLKDDDRGYTNVIVQSEQGKKLLQHISERYEMYKADTEKAINLDGIMVLNSAKPHIRRSEFYVGIDGRTMQEQIQKFIPVRKLDILVERGKVVLYRLGIYRIVRKVLGK
ncbi:Coenzyme F420 hydrogenase/dehydrogenase, beta subunit C-terminal domain [Faecalicoccus pleomorphus]|uniref:Coenzyme F420 hydrogenase/dehydrogenase, beta subunit C-terminal domain n=1 Tax=Faecalicoccus pleomorphus TaxID=1323 RepID=UPI001961FACB|nr:Coenzyme F420 hydrogenase/dehydrogenase, beta subunit C-terminal domain [Faecalicoccus pleomorphus]MBM6765069.1 Coenzyme F420 hydrogenase/dehydrogenase, beta subunit C-terminal domain [Faecalicoccus pleomorphus]